jgi:hypothetical protein
MDALYLLLFVVAMVIGFGAGVVYSYVRAFKVLEQELWNMHENASDKTGDILKVNVVKDDTGEQQLVNGVELAHEIVDNIHLFYLKSSDGSRKFVCQGSTLDDAAVAYQRSFKSHPVAIFINSVTNKQSVFMQGKYYE